MRHGHYAPRSADPWMIGVIVALLLAAVIILIVWLIHRRTIASDGLTPSERKSLPYAEREILSLLRQHGGPMAQTEVVEALPSDFQDLAEALKRIEERGLIRREWQADRGTYLISTNP